MKYTIIDIVIKKKKNLIITQLDAYENVAAAVLLNLALITLVSRYLRDLANFFNKKWSLVPRILLEANERQWNYYGISKSTFYVPYVSGTVTLTHGGPVRIYVRILGHYLNTCWFIFYWTFARTVQWNISKIKPFSYKKGFWKCRLQDDGHFVPASMC